MPDSDYAAEDIHSAVEKIVSESGQDKIDILGWSWGTVTASRYASKNTDHLNRLVLYAPILSGIGKYEVTEDFHHNTWEHAADYFQRDPDGSFDYTITEREMVEMFCSSCRHYDDEYSSNGGRLDICIEKSEKLIDLSKITVPTLVICGGSFLLWSYALSRTSPTKRRSLTIKPLKHKLLRGVQKSSDIWWKTYEIYSRLQILLLVCFSL